MMTSSNSQNSINLQALLLVDHAYRDQASGKFILAGVFHHIYSPGFPANFGRTVGLYISLTGVQAQAALEVDFVDPLDGAVLMHREPIQIAPMNTTNPVEIAIEVPHLPLPHAGVFLFRVWVDGGLLGECSLTVEAAQAPV